MCIFSQPIISVVNTRMFARTSPAGTQFLVYQMSYESPHANAMILPLPVRRPARDQSLRFLNLENYETFFDDIEDGFPYSAPVCSIGCSAPYDPTSRHELAVFEVGSYLASFVPTLADFSRLDTRFTLPEETWSRVPQYRAHGFAVFQLAEGAMKPHPMAFEFESARDSIYFPTLHVHDGEVHDTEEFDHALYLQHAGFDSRVHGYRNAEFPDHATGLVRSKYVARRFCDVDRSAGVVDGNLLVHRQLIRGRHSNHDIEIPTFGDPSRRTINLRPLLSYSPWLVGGAAVAWFLARRGVIKGRKAREASSDPRDYEA